MAAPSRLLVLIPMALPLLVAGAARAEWELSVYGGANAANGSVVTLSTSSVSGDFDVDWFGDSFNSPPYYGARATYWLESVGLPQWGIAVDFTHAKVKADRSDPAVGGAFSRLEFTNGLNTLTLNALYRQPLGARLSLYGGIGAGASIPHVEVSTIPATADTFEYQLTGPALQALGGASVDLGRGFSLFGEYKASYSLNEARLDDGGTLETDILAHHFAAGLSFRFGGPGR